jgi:4-amino-4-deoxy-L-arabinose transferase-like glycosyltransferase
MNPGPAHASRLFALGGVALFAVLAAWSAWRMSPTVDERDHIAFGRDILAGTRTTASMQKMAVTALNAAPLAAAETFGIRLSPRKALFAARAVTILAALLLLLLVRHVAARRYGRAAGDFALFLAVFCPTTLAHGSVATNDLFAAASMFAAVLAFETWLRQRTWLWWSIAALATALALLSKQTALLLPAVYVVMFLLVRRERPAPAGRVGRRAALAVVGAAAWIAVVLLVVNAAYAFRESFRPIAEYRGFVMGLDESRTYRALAAQAGGVPVPLPRAFAESIAVGALMNEWGSGHLPVYLLGTLNQKGFRHYYVVAAALKWPLPFLLVLALSLVALLAPAARKRWRAEAVLLLPAALVFAFLSFTTAQIGVRYLLPMLPFLHVFCGGALARTFARGRALRAAILLLGIWQAVSVLSYHPHQIAYFNEVVLDRRQAWRYLADSNLDWGQATRVMEEYRRANRDREIHVNPPWPVSGTVLVNANRLTGTSVPPEVFAWLRDGPPPVRHVAHAWLVFEVPPGGPAVR